MNADNRQLLERAADLQGLTARKKFQLAKPEQEECIKVLSSLIESNADNAEKALALLPEFPSDVGALVLMKMWDHLKAQKFPIFQRLRSAKFSSDLCKRLRLVLGCQLIPLSPPDSLRVLVDICQDMKSAKKNFPTAKDLKLICTAFLHNGYSLLHKLPLADIEERQVQLLVVYLLAAGFLAKNKEKTICAQEAQLALLRWTKAFAKLSYIPPEVAKGITGDWSGDYRKIVAREMDDMHASIRRAVVAAVGAATAVERPDVPAGGATTRFQAQEDQDKSQYDPLYEITRLAEHIKHRDMLLKETMQQLRQAERDWNATRSELEVTRRDREELKVQLAMEREKSIEARREYDQLTKSRDAVVEELNITKAALKAA